GRRPRYGRRGTPGGQAGPDRPVPARGGPPPLWGLSGRGNPPPPRRPPPGNRPLAPTPAAPHRPGHPAPPGPPPAPPVPTGGPALRHAPLPPPRDRRPRLHARRQGTGRRRRAQPAGRIRREDRPEAARGRQGFREQQLRLRPLPRRHARRLLRLRPDAVGPPH